MTAQLKLTAALPERARASAQKVAARFHLDPVDWFRSAEAARLLPAIAKAVWSETCVDIRYKRGTGAVARRLAPLGLVLKAGIWYLVARIGEQIRTYRVGNILEIVTTDQHFERPQDFDLVGFWTTSTRAYEIGIYRANAVLRLTPQGLSKLDGLGAAVQQAARESAGPPEKDGWVRVTIPIESIDQAATDLLRLGLDAEVLTPVALRRRLAKAAREIVRLYG
jgi:predicted DNA-binding transcriptional regulator YafY